MIIYIGQAAFFSVFLESVLQWTWLDISVTASGQYICFRIAFQRRSVFKDKTRQRNSWVYVRQYCAEIEEAARKRMELIVPKLAKQYGVTEQLKADNQMEWVRQMNACKAQAEEIVKAELIYDWARKSGQKTVRTFLI